MKKSGSLGWITLAVVFCLWLSAATVACGGDTAVIYFADGRCCEGAVLSVNLEAKGSNESITVEIDGKEEILKARDVLWVRTDTVMYTSRGGIKGFVKHHPSQPVAIDRRTRVRISETTAREEAAIAQLEELKNLREIQRMLAYEAIVREHVWQAMAKQRELRGSPEDRSTDPNDQGLAFQQIKREAEVILRLAHPSTSLKDVELIDMTERDGGEKTVRIQFRYRGRRNDAMVIAFQFEGLRFAGFQVVSDTAPIRPFRVASAAVNLLKDVALTRGLSKHPALAQIFSAVTPDVDAKDLAETWLRLTINS